MTDRGWSELYAVIETTYVYKIFKSNDVKHRHAVNGIIQDFKAGMNSLFVILVMLPHSIDNNMKIV